MTADKFRSLALELPETAEAEHMDHPDFRVCGKIFATLSYPDDEWGMVKLTPAQQKAFCRAEPDVFRPVPGGWGRQGCTHVRLRSATVAEVRKAILAAWRNRAPQSLVKEYDEGRLSLGQ